MSPTTTDPTLDVTSDLSGVYIKRADVEHGDYRFVIAAVSRETFEARDGKPSQTKVVLTSNDTPPRKFSLNKVNLRKEFFFATPLEVREALEEKLGSLLEFSEKVESTEYLQSRRYWPDRRGPGGAGDSGANQTQ